MSFSVCERYNQKKETPEFLFVYRLWEKNTHLS